MKKLCYVLFFVLFTGFSGLVVAVEAGNMSDANVPINTELVQPLGDFSQISVGTQGSTPTSGTSATKAATSDTAAAPTQTLYEKLLRFLGL